MKSVECEPAPVESAPAFLSALDLVVGSHVVGSHEQPRRANPATASTRPSAPATAIGRLAGFTEAGVPLVEVPGDRGLAAVAARTAVLLESAHIGSEVVLCFAAGDLGQPIILGLLLAPSPAVPLEAPSVPPPAQVELNGQRLELTAEDELVLRCGKSSITLTRAGKVIIRGEYLLSRSSGVNRIKGGSVQIN